MFRYVQKSIIFKNMMTVANKRPIEINIETTNKCLSKCIFCPNSKLPKTKELMEMSLFKKICNDYYNLGGGQIGISSMQSDIFTDELLFERLDVLKNYKDKFILHTSTMLSGASRLSDSELTQVLESFDRIDISIGGLTESDYKEMFGINSFKKVLEQLIRIEKLINQRSIRTKLTLNFRTNNPDNIRKNELLGYLKKTYIIGEISNNFFSWGGIITQNDLPKGAIISPVNNQSEKIDCVVPWSSFCINANGSVIGCGCVDWQAQHVVGNLKDQSIMEIWKGDKAVDFRTAISNDKIPDLCKECSLYCNVENAFSRVGLINYRPSDGAYYYVKFSPGNIFRKWIKA
jgi:radical SAM protein with 4Fe4S-binding SPASM domain